MPSLFGSFIGMQSAIVRQNPIIRKGVVSMEASKSEAGKKNWEQDSLEIGVQKQGN